MSIVTRERNTRIGASDAAAVLGISPYASPYDVWAVKTGRAEEFSGNDTTRAGNRLESMLLDDAEKELGDLDRNVFIPGPAGTPIGATLDAQVISTGEIVEAKTSGMTGGPVVGDWGEPGTDRIPDHYLVQVQLQMWVARAERAHVFAYLGNVMPKRFAVEYDHTLAMAIAEQLSDWWTRHVIADVPPDATGVSMETIKRFRRTAEKSIELAGDEADQAELLCRKIEELKVSIKARENELEAAQAALLLMLGDAEEMVLPSGNRVTYFQTTRKGHTVKASTYRQLRIKEKK